MESTELTLLRELAEDARRMNARLRTAEKRLEDLRLAMVDATHHQESSAALLIRAADHARLAVVGLKRYGQLSERVGIPAREIDKS